MANQWLKEICHYSPKPEINCKRYNSFPRLDCQYPYVSSCGFSYYREKIKNFLLAEKGEFQTSNKETFYMDE